MDRLGVWRERDVVELAEAQPLAIDRDAKVAQINGLPGSLGDLVCGGSRGFALRRQIRHDDSACARQNQHHRRGKGRGAVQKMQELCVPTAREGQKNKRMKDEKRIRGRNKKGQDGKGPQQPSAGVRKGAPPLYACILLSSLLQLSETGCCLCLLLLHRLLLFSLLLSPFVPTGDLKCNREHRAEKSQPSSGQLSTGSL